MIPFYYSLATSSIVLGFRFIQIAQKPKLDFDAKIANFSMLEFEIYRFGVGGKLTPLAEKTDEVMLNTIIERLL